MELVFVRHALPYGNNSEASNHALPGGRLWTGDVAVMDEGGWVYLVDRLKDQINVSGYKAWPREVEDVLYEHPAVRGAPWSASRMSTGVKRRCFRIP